MTPAEKLFVEKAPGHVPAEEGLEPARAMLPVGPLQPWPIQLLGQAIDWSLIAIGGVMIALVITNVVFHIAGRDIAWTVELCEFLMVWATFLGGASTARRGQHMSITEFLDKLSTGKRRLADGAIQLFSAVVLAVLAWFGWGIVDSSWGNTLTTLGWPMALQYLPLPIGSVFTFVFVAYDLTQIFDGKSPEERYGVHH